MIQTKTTNHNFYVKGLDLIPLYIY